MAGNGLTRKFMTALGVSSEAQDEIIAKYDEILTEIKTERDTYRQKAEQLDTITAERDNLQKKLNDPEQANRVAELEKQIAEYQKRETTAQKRTALTALLEKIGIDKRGFARVLAATDLDGVEMDGENIKDADKLAESLKTEWSDLLTEPGATGKPPQTPPQNPGNGGMTKEQIMAIKDRDERRVAIAQHLDLFQSNTKGE